MLQFVFKSSSTLWCRTIKFANQLSESVEFNKKEQQIDDNTGARQVWTHEFQQHIVHVEVERLHDLDNSRR